MPRYNNQNPDAAITAIEFSPQPAGNFSFLYLRSEADTESTKEWLNSPAMGQQLIAKTTINGAPVLITQGTKSQQDVLTSLATQGNQFVLHHPKKEFSFWVLRGTMGTIGQLGQVASSLMPASGKIDHATLTFAAANLVANGINIIFGAEKKNDTHHEIALKEELNRKVAPHLPAQAGLPAIDDNRTLLRKEPQRPQGLGDKAYNFLQRNSVLFGEIGLRYFGSFALAFPVRNWKGGMNALRHGNVVEAFHAAKNDHSYSLAGGLIYLAGKTIALTSKIPDPYEPKEHTIVDSFREKVSFRLSSMIESCAGATIAYDRLMSPDRKIKFPDSTLVPSHLRGAIKQDYFGGVGGLLFSSAYITRFFAPLGTKDLNVEEIKAHVSDSLANLPPEQIPQLLADCAATIKEHSGDKPIEFGQIYTQILTDLYRYHHVTQENISSLGSTRRDNDPFPQLTRQVRTGHPKAPVLANDPTLRPNSAPRALLDSAEAQPVHDGRVSSTPRELDSLSA